MIFKHIALFFFFCTFTANATDTALSQLIEKTYNFKPNELSKEEKNAKNPVLSEFFKTIQSDKEKHLPALRLELQSNRHTPYFYYDAGLMLLRSSYKNSDRELFLSVLKKVDLTEIDHNHYLQTIFKLARIGYDCSDASLHLLTNPSFKAFIPQHFLSLGTGWSFTVSLIPQNEDEYLHKIIHTLKNQPDNPQNIHLVHALWYSDSPEAISMLETIPKDKHYPENIRATSTELLNNDLTISDALDQTAILRIFEALKVNPSISYPALKKERQKRFSSISDEKLNDFKKMTTLLKWKRIME